MRQRLRRRRPSASSSAGPAGDWGEEAAFHAADHLTSLAREIPEAVAAHVNGMLGAILAMCAPGRAHRTPAVPAHADGGCPEREMVAALERESARIRRDGSPAAPGRDYRALRLGQPRGRARPGGGAVLGHDRR